MTPLHAWVLAAGQGRRLGGRTKAALRIDGRSLLARLLDAVHEGAAPAAVTVVCGADRAAWAALREELAGRPGLHLIDPDAPLPTIGHSRRWALRQHLGSAPADTTDDAPDLLLCVADLPWLEAADVAALCRAWRADPHPPFDALRPVVDGRAVRALAVAPPETHPREALQAAGLRLSMLALDRPGPVTDLDTPEDLQALRAAWPRADIRWPDD